MSLLPWSPPRWCTRSGWHHWWSPGSEVGCLRLMMSPAMGKSLLTGEAQTSLGWFSLKRASFVKINHGLSGYGGGWWFAVEFIHRLRSDSGLSAHQHHCFNSNMMKLYKQKHNKCHTIPSNVYDSECKLDVISLFSFSSLHPFPLFPFFQLHIFYTDHYAITLQAP